MEKITVIGPFNDQMKKCINDSLPSGMSLNYINSYDEYDSLSDSDYVILRTLRMDREHIDKLNKAKLIQRWGAGYDTVDIQYAGSKGIKVGACFGVNAQSVAELTIGLILAIYRNLIPLNTKFVEGEDLRVKYGERAYCIENKTVGILGMGNIGKRVAKILQAFGANIIYYDAFRLNTEEEKTLGYTYMEMNEVLQNSDIISLHLPLLDTTKDIINKETISLMKDGALLVNTARAGLIDENALSEAIKNNKLIGAGLDELKQSYQESPFMGLENVICTPHTGGSTVDINDTMAKTCMNNIESVRKGGDPSPFVNKEYMDCGVKKI